MTARKSDAPLGGPKGIPKGVAHSGIGISFALTIGLCAWGGHWLDERYDTGPWLIIVGSMLGFALGTYELVKLTRKLERSTQRARAARSSEGPEQAP